MSEWKAKRFWTDTSVVKAEGGFTVQLDGRPVKTPAKTLLVVPTETLAQEIAREWEAQEGAIDPNTMPYTRSSNAALDKVSAQKTEVADLIAAYGESDLLCYRAESPKELQDRQAAAWDPMLDWTESVLSARLATGAGVMHIDQPSASIASLSVQVHEQDNFALTALHDLVSLSGSLVLGLATQAGLHPAEKIWELSRIDEVWQAELWGDDDEAREHAELKKQAFLHASRFFALSRRAV